ncbi:MAG: FAD-dependent oxidoreductase [Anaerolineae bacterium]|nr:FAD-dependent oxidoreductase [Anaerolineae bacterium]
MFQVLFGFIPWIIFWSLSGPGWWTPAILGALLAAAALVTWRWSKRRDVKTMEVVSLGYFAAHAVVTLALGSSFFIDYGAVLNSLALAGMAFGTLLAGSPFTYQYARESWAPELWDNPLFRLTNQIITGVWGGIFLVNSGLGALSLALPQHAVLLNAVIANVLIGLGITFSSLFPNWFPNFALQRSIDARQPYKWRTPSFDGHPSGETEHDVIVIGAGIGGLTTAALLAKRGLKVAVFEQHFLPGGYCTSWERGIRQPHGSRLRYIFDAGVHDVSGLGERGPVRNLMRQLDIEEEVDWKRMDHEYTLDGLRVAIPRDPSAFATRLGELFPGERDAIRQYFDEMTQIYREMYADLEQSGGVPTTPRTVKDMMAYPQSHPHAYKWMDRPFTEMLGAFFQDERLKRFLSALTGYLSDDPSLLTVGAMAPIFGYYIDGGYYPAGGSQKFADALVAVIEAHGGKVHLRTPVERILVMDGQAAGVELAVSGQQHRAKALVSNADMKRTFLELVGAEHLPKKFARQAAAAQPSTSAFMVFLGLDYLPQVAPILMSDAIGIMTPSVVDNSLAPKGHAAMTLISLIPQAQAVTWERKAADYQVRKRAFGDTMIAEAEKLIPDLSQHIVYRQDATPRTFERYAWSDSGAIYGPAQDALHPPLKSPLPGLYLTGSGVYPGAGVEAVVISGTLAADAIYNNARQA